MLLVAVGVVSAVVVIASRWLRRRDDDGYWDRDWSDRAAQPGLRIDFRRSGRDQRP